MAEKDKDNPLQFRHEISLADPLKTVCGITYQQAVKMGAGKGFLACDCHKPDCGLPVNCPSCLAGRDMDTEAGINLLKALILTNGQKPHFV